MERVILFRGKRYATDEWVEGPLLAWPDETTEICKTSPDDENEFLKFVARPDTVGQYTGMTDKAGRKAFEHDIIKHHFGDEVGVIRYGEYRNPFGDDSHGGHVGFYVDWVAGTCPEALRKDLGYWMKCAEIIGNIHNNPELLEVGHAQE